MYISYTRCGRQAGLWARRYWHFLHSTVALRADQLWCSPLNYHSLSRINITMQKTQPSIKLYFLPALAIFSSKRSVSFPRCHNILCAIRMHRETVYTTGHIFMCVTFLLLRTALSYTSSIWTGKLFLYICLNAEVFLLPSFGFRFNSFTVVQWQGS